MFTDYNPINADVAVVQGFVHPGSKNSKHLNLRKEVFEKQQRDNKRSIIVDSNLFSSYRIWVSITIFSSCWKNTIITIS